jgi:hypothetical protein
VIKLQVTAADLTADGELVALRASIYTRRQPPMPVAKLLLSM